MTHHAHWSVESWLPAQSVVRASPQAFSPHGSWQGMKARLLSGLFVLVRSWSLPKPFPSPSSYEPLAFHLLGECWTATFALPTKHLSKPGRGPAPHWCSDIFQETVPAPWFFSPSLNLMSSTPGDLRDSSIALGKDTGTFSKRDLKEKFQRSFSKVLSWQVKIFSSWCKRASALFQVIQ